MYAGVMGIKEAIHVQQLLGWKGEPVRIRLRMDAAAARSVLCRQGVGRIRHLEVKVLWAQDQVKIGRVLVEKVEGTLTLTRQTWARSLLMRRPWSGIAGAWA